MNHSRRAARVMCTTDSIFGVLEKKDYNKAIATSLKKEVEQKM
jgi:hypothetical protein